MSRDLPEHGPDRPTEPAAADPPREMDPVNQPTIVNSTDLPLGYIEHRHGAPIGRPQTFSGDPATEAFEAQGTYPYPNVDNPWTTRVFEAGELVVQGYDSKTPGGGTSEFFGSLDALWLSDGSAAAYNQLVQVGARNGTYRDGVRVYRLKEDVLGAEAPVSAHDQYGRGGAQQSFLPNPAFTPDLYEAVPYGEVRQLLGKDIAKGTPDDAIDIPLSDPYMPGPDLHGSPTRVFLSRVSLPPDGVNPP